MLPNLHLLLPSSTPDVPLEARIYLSPNPALPLVTSSSSEPTPLADLTAAQRGVLRDLGVVKVVTVAHPWGRLGGNMMFPVISTHIPAALLPAPIAIATYNARGIGRSGGSQPVPGFGFGSDPADYAAVERAVVELVGAREVYRVGYSYGNNSALLAPAPTFGTLRRRMLISPAPTMFKLLTAVRGPTFAAGLAAALAWADAQAGTGAAVGGAEAEKSSGAGGKPAASTTDSASNSTSATHQPASGPDPRALWHVYGTEDDFTGVATLRALGENRHVVRVEIEGCGHFYTRGEDAEALRRAVVAWISGE